LGASDLSGLVGWSISSSGGFSKWCFSDMVLSNSPSIESQLPTLSNVTNIRKLLILALKLLLYPRLM
jgi:hypothetical protein